MGYQQPGMDPFSCKSSILSIRTSSDYLHTKQSAAEYARSDLCGALISWGAHPGMICDDRR